MFGSPDDLGCFVELIMNDLLQASELEQMSSWLSLADPSSQVTDRSLFASRCDKLAASARLSF